MMAAECNERERGGEREEESPRVISFPPMRRTKERLGITVWCFLGEIELEAAFFSFFFFMDGMMKAQGDFYVEQVSQ